MARLTSEEASELIGMVVRIIRAETREQRVRDAQLVRECLAEASKQGLGDLLTIAGVTAQMIETQPDRTIDHLTAALRELAEERAGSN